MRKSFLLALPFVFAALAVAGVLHWASWNGNRSRMDSLSGVSEREVVINGRRMKLEIVASETDVALGLGGRDFLPQDRGMLFLLKPGIHPFWMKGMRFPIDIVWLRDGIAVEIASRLPPPKTDDEFPATHTPRAFADMVMELGAGQAQTLGIVIGTRVFPQKD